MIRRFATPRKSTIAITVITVVAAILRLWRFPDLPGGLNQDEASAGYESLALLTDGTDRWGNAWPVYFPSWGSGQNVLLSYLSVPFVGLFGLTVFSVRLVPVLLGIGAVPLLHAALRRFVDVPTALVGAGLLAVTPWHVTASRWALESNILPFFLLAGVTTLGYAYTSSRSRILIPFSLVFLALSLYAYGVAIFVVPVVIGLYFCTRYRTVLKHPVLVGSSVLVFLVVAGPLLLFVLVNNVLHHVPHFVSSLPFTVPNISSRLDQITNGQDLAELNTHFVTGGFGDGYLWTVPTGFLALGVIGFPLVALGVYFAVRTRSPETNLFTFWLIGAVILLFVVPANGNRANALFIPLIAFTAIGIGGLYRALSDRKTGRAVVAVVMATALGYGALFFHDYTTRYPDRIAAPFGKGFDDALKSANGAQHANEPIYISDRFPLNYMETLFYLRTDPKDFRANTESRLVDGVYQVRNYRHYYFSSNETSLDAAPSYLAVLRGDEQRKCARTDTLAKHHQWTVIRCATR
ncbi:glycosyltransferase family 39 protein [Streptomyces rubellomurinus]|uniref:glycosyltransferase family 39 protein n=1 Tax=Streptomyces rubellomurinus (strain ATCC 31215) TaxID=359131 RepID=UPI0014289669|nr:glycosyltransferase family 39 protein [Streptomyces rubellomurinus]